MDFSLFFFEDEQGLNSLPRQLPRAIKAAFDPRSTGQLRQDSKVFAQGQVSMTSKIAGGANRLLRSWLNLPRF
jgi:hypothetical protein